MEKKIDEEKLSDLIENLGKAYRLNEICKRRLETILLDQNIQFALNTKQFAAENLIIAFSREDKQKALLAISSPEARKFFEENLEMHYVTSVEFVREILASPERLLELKELALSMPFEFMTYAGAISRCEERKITGKMVSTEEKAKIKKLFRLSRKLYANPKGRLLYIEEGVLYQELRDNSAGADKIISSAADKYFEEYFLLIEKQKIKPAPYGKKESGIHAGLVATFNFEPSREYSEETSKRYYIKTHGSGTLRSDMSSYGSKNGHVDVKELFVYKFLELIGYGPKSHFFWDTYELKEIYIATQDVKFHKDPKKLKEFYLYDEKAEAYFNGLGECEEKNVAVKEILCLGLLSKILMLSDVFTNPGNFGYVQLPNAQKWKIIDFGTGEISENIDIAKQFYDGNAGNLLSRDLPKSFITAIFRCSLDKKKEQIAAVLNALGALEHGRKCTSSSKFKMPFKSAVVKASSIINTFIDNSAFYFGASPMIKESFCLYCENIVKNFEHMKNSSVLL